VGLPKSTKWQMASGINNAAIQSCVYPPPPPPPPASDKDLLALHAQVQALSKNIAALNQTMSGVLDAILELHVDTGTLFQMVQDLRAWRATMKQNVFTTGRL
jgi:hypothetical protein